LRGKRDGFVDSTGDGDLAANASTIGERESRRVPGIIISRLMIFSRQENLLHR